MSDTIYAASGDGCVRNMTQATWAAARGNASGTLAQPTPGNAFGAYVGKNGAADWDVIRGFLAFDLSGIPAGATITAATLSVQVNTVYDLLGSGGLGVVEGTQASISTLATSDFSLVGSTELATRKTLASLSTSVYTDFALNAAGLAVLQAGVGSSAKLALRTGRDIDNTTPASTNYEGVLVYFSEQTGTSQDPKLVVTYVAATQVSASDTFSVTDATPAVSVAVPMVQPATTVPFTAADGTELHAYSASFVDEVSTPGYIYGNRFIGPTSGASLYTYAVAQADLTVEADILYRTQGGAQAYTYTTLWAREALPSARTGYAAIFGQYDNGTNGGLILRRYNANGTTTDLGTYTMTLVAGTTYHVKFVVAGSALTVYVDGVSRIAVTDSTFSAAGNSGIAQSGTEHAGDGFGNAVDNFQITPAVSGLGGDTVTLTEGSGSITDPSTVAKTASDAFTATDAYTRLLARIDPRSGAWSQTAYTTRAAYAGAVTVRNGGGTAGTQYPFGVLLSNGDIRVYYAATGTGITDGTLSKVSTDKGATWGATEHVDDFNIISPPGPYDSSGGLTMVRRGQSGRLHGACVTRVFHGDTSIFPAQPGWVVQYEPYYVYSDDDGATWSTPEPVPYSGYAAVAMDVTELSNGEVLIAWYGNGPDPGAGPYTENVPYYDCKVSRRSAAGTWSVAGVMGSYAGTTNVIGSYCVEPQIDVIHDGSTYGKLIGHFHAENGPPQTMYITTSTDGGTTWTTPVSVATGSNRGGLCVTPDGDVIFCYNSGTLAYYKVSQDQGATWSAATSVIAGSSQPGGGTYVGNKWVTPFPIGAAATSPNLGIAWGSSDVSDAIGSTFFRSFTRGATAAPVIAPGQAMETATVADSAGVTVGVGAITKTASDTFNVTDTSGGIAVTYRKTATEAILVTDSSGTSTTTEPVKYRLPVSANFVSARSHTAQFVSARSQTADFIPSPSTVT